MCIGRQNTFAFSSHFVVESHANNNALHQSTSVDLDDLPREGGGADNPDSSNPQDKNQNSGDEDSADNNNIDEDEQLPDVASFPVLVCMLLNADGTAPDIRKLIPLSNLTTVQDLHATVVQLAFDNGDTVRLDSSSPHAWG